MWLFFKLDRWCSGSNVSLMQVDVSGWGGGVGGGGVGACHNDVIGCFELDWRCSGSNASVMRVDFLDTFSTLFAPIAVQMVE